MRPGRLTERRSGLKPGRRSDTGEYFASEVSVCLNRPLGPSYLSQGHSSGRCLQNLGIRSHTCFEDQGSPVVAKVLSHCLLLSQATIVLAEQYAEHFQVGIDIKNFVNTS